VDLWLESPSATLKSFLESLAASDGSAGQVLTAALNGFKVRLVVNKARDKRDYHLGRSIVDVVRKFFLIDMGFLGTVPYDERVHWSLKKFSPFLLDHPESEAAGAIRSMAETLSREFPRASAEELPAPRA
jgi:flagellar biosynthesis protein FlhG